MTVESAFYDLEQSYEGSEIARIEISSWSNEFSIPGDNENTRWKHYKNGVKTGEEIRPKRKLYQWELDKLTKATSN